MARVIKTFSRFCGGISEFDKESLIPSGYAFSRALDIRTNPQNLTLLPKAIKESGSVVTDLPKWGEVYNSNLTSYLYGNTGNLYSRTSAGSYSFLRQVANSHGNGEVYSAEDDFLYYSSDKLIGRYGPLSGTPTFVDDFFGSQGGVPLNTNSLQLLSASSQYADRPDTASLSVTGNLSIRAQIKPTTLPAVGSSMTLASKWNLNGNLRSYMLDIATVSGFYGDGSDGALTISSNTTESPIDSTASATAGTSSISATNTSFAANQIVLIMQMVGTNAGQWEIGTISSYTAGTITTVSPLKGTYLSSGSNHAQVRVVPQYTNVTINSGITYKPKAWSQSGFVGGLLAFYASGTVTVSGTISGDSRGFDGGAVPPSPTGNPGDGTGGLELSHSTAANGNGGGGAGNQPQYAGAGGGNGTAGSNGTGGATGGNAVGSTDLTAMTLGGAGGSGGWVGGSQSTGGNGGAMLFCAAPTITITGTITFNGGNGGSPNQPGTNGGAGGAAGGSLLFKAQTWTNSGTITASGGTGGAGSSGGDTGGAGGDGRIHLDYYSSYTGTSTPTLNALQDNTLVGNVGYQLRLSVSSNGTNSETLSQSFVPKTGVWQQVGVSWTASTSTAIFYLNAVQLGTRVGTLTSIADTTARFAVGANFNSGGSATNFYNGLIDEVQVYNMTQSYSDFFNALSQQISSTSAGLKGYWKFNGDYVDATANANDLTSSGSPSFTTDVPFSSPTTRLDIDQSATTTGNTYTPPTSISETSSNRLTFTPAKDPQKSVAFLVATVGTGAWTVTIHDSFNNTIATSTITNANMATGYVEFTYASNWRPLTNFTNSYHLHITSTVADGAVTTTTASNLETVSYRTYYQFLVTDTAWHPMTRFLNFWVVGNEKWVGKYEATLYEPNKIALGANWRARCFGKWGEYLVIGAMRGSNIYDFDTGKIFFWDGYSPTYNYSVEITDGGVNALLGVGDKLYIWAGYRNQLLEYTGGLTARKIKYIPKLETTKYSEVYPQAVTMWQSLLRYAPSGSSNSETFQKGVYTWGQSSIRYPEVLSYDYIPSTGNNGSTVNVGLIMVVNNKLLMGYQDGLSYGVDYIDPTTTSFGSGTIEFLVDDQDQIWKQKDALNIKVVFSPIVSGDSFSLKYKINGENNWSASTTTTTTDDTSLVLSVPTGRYNEFQFACDFSTSNTETPILKGLGFEINDLKEEETI